MNSLLEQPAFALYAICSSFLIVSLYALGFLTAKTRADRKAVVNAEDAGTTNRGATVVEVEHGDVQRLKRAHQNALENAVPFFVIGLLYTQTAPGITAVRVLFFTFVAARLLHAVFYATATQPYRTLSFVVGSLINLAMVVQVLRAVL